MHSHFPGGRKDCEWVYFPKHPAVSGRNLRQPAVLSTLLDEATGATVHNSCREQGRSAELWLGELPSCSLLTALPIDVCMNIFKQALIPLSLCAVSVLPHPQTPWQRLNKNEITDQALGKAVMSLIPSHSLHWLVRMDEDGRHHATLCSLGSIATVGTVPGGGLSLVNEGSKKIHL